MTMTLTVATEQQAVRAQVFAHPIRRAAMQMMANDPEGVSPKMMAAALGLPLGNVAYHVQVLRQLKVIRLRTKKPRRGAVEHFWVLRDEYMAGVCPTCGRPLPSDEEEAR